jgi:hypothetical protein
MNYNEKTKQLAQGLATSIEVYNAIGWIAEMDNYPAKKLWENGYTDKHTYDEVAELIKQYIRETVPADEIEPKYYWGDGEPIVMCEKRTKWVLMKNNTEIIDEMEYSDEEYEINGTGDILWSLIPLEMTDAAQNGEWDQEGFNWHYKRDYYIIKPLKQN